MPETVCPFCSLACPVSLRFDQFGGYAYDFQGDNKLCAKGIALLDVLNSERRAVIPYSSGELSTAQDVAARIKGFKDARVTISPFSSLETARFALSLAKSFGSDEVGVIGIEGDYELLDGALDPGITDPAELSGFNTFFAFVDVFNMAPPMARPILTAHYEEKGKLVALQPTASKTAAFAQTWIETNPRDSILVLQETLKRLDPGHPLSGLKTEPAPAVMSAAERLVEEIKGSGKPVFLLGTVLGSVPDLYLHSSIVHSLAKAAEGGVFHVLSGGNAFGLYLRRDRFVPAGTLSGGSAICLDTCHLELYPDRTWKERAILSAFAGDKAQVLPKAIGPEEGGTYETGAGRTLVPEAMEPASGALLLSRIGEVMGVPSTEDVSVAEFESKIDPDKIKSRFTEYLGWREEMTPGPNEFVLIYDNSHRFFLHEEFNENSQYLTHREPELRVLLSPLAVKKLEATDGALVQVSTSAGELPMTVEVTEGLEPGTALVRRASGLALFERRNGIPVPTRAKLRKGSNG
jgi:hypothetical protein